MSTDSFTSALERLDPASRALLDLSLRRGMRSDEIAEILGADPANVAASRDEALRRIAADVGMDTAGDLDEVRARLAELPVEGWLGAGAVATNGNGAHAVEDAEAEAEAEEPEPAVAAEEPRRHRVILPVLLGLLVIAGVVAIVLGTGGGTSKRASSSTPAAPAPRTPKPSGGPVSFTPVGSIKGKGHASVKNNRLSLRITGLPKDRYGVWLFNNVIDAQSLGYATGRTIVGRNLRLPRNWRSFRYVDVSREPNDGNLNHSGLSVMRVPTSKLGGGS